MTPLWPSLLPLWHHPRKSFSLSTPIIFEFLSQNHPASDTMLSNFRVVRRRRKWNNRLSGESSWIIYFNFNYPDRFVNGEGQQLAGMRLKKELVVLALRMVGKFTRWQEPSPGYFFPVPTLALAVPRTFLVLFFLSFFCFLLTLALGSMTPWIIQNIYWLTSSKIVEVRWRFLMFRWHLRDLHLLPPTLRWSSTL